MTYNDAQHLASQIDSARSYKEYIPDEVMMSEPESERFARLIRNMKRTLLTMDPDDLREWQEEQLENR